MVLDEPARQIYHRTIRKIVFLNRTIYGVYEPRINTYFNYNEWRDSVNNKAQKYIKPRWVLTNKWNSDNRKYEKKWILTPFHTEDLAEYKNYIANILLSMPLHDRNYISHMELGLYYRRDSLAYLFLNKLTARSSVFSYGFLMRKPLSNNAIILI